jgi:hypothetical protein
MNFIVLAAGEDTELNHSLKAVQCCEVQSFVELLDTGHLNIVLNGIDDPFFYFIHF